MRSKSLLPALVLFAAFVVAGWSNSPAETESIAVADGNGVRNPEMRQQAY